MTELQLYIKENKGESLEIGETISGQFYIRPATWAGIWDGNKLVRGNTLVLFNSREEAENILKKVSKSIWHSKK